MEETYNRSKILLETGTNELEIMVLPFMGSCTVSMWQRLKRIMMSNEVKPMPHAHPLLKGYSSQEGHL